MPDPRTISILRRGMRYLVYMACILAVGAMLGSTVAAAQTTGTLSVEGGRGSVVLDIRGSVLGRLGSGTLRVTDVTPRDRFEPLVTGRKFTEERIGPRTVVYRGTALRFRMLGGAYRIVVRGGGISISAVGRGSVVLVADPRLLGEDPGVYSTDGADCGLEPELCTPLPEEPERIFLGPAETTRSGAK